MKRPAAVSPAIVEPPAVPSTGMEPHPPSEEPAFGSHIPLVGSWEADDIKEHIGQRGNKMVSRSGFFIWYGASICEVEDHLLQV